MPRLTVGDLVRDLTKLDPGLEIWIEDTESNEGLVPAGHWAEITNLKDWGDKVIGLYRDEGYGYEIHSAVQE